MMVSCDEMLLIVVSRSLTHLFSSLQKFIVLFAAIFATAMATQYVVPTYGYNYAPVVSYAAPAYVPSYVNPVSSSYVQSSSGSNGYSYFSDPHSYIHTVPQVPSVASYVYAPILKK